MKTLLIVFSLFLISCGGDVYIEEKEDWEVDVELCEAQDGKAEILHVTNIDTGETYIDVNCVFPKRSDTVYQCKLNGNCPS